MNPKEVWAFGRDILIVCGVFWGWEDGGSVSEGWPEPEDKEKLFVLCFYKKTQIV